MLLGNTSIRKRCYLSCIARKGGRGTPLAEFYDTFSPTVFHSLFLHKCKCFEPWTGFKVEYLCFPPLIQQFCKPCECHLEKGPATKSDEFLEKFQTAGWVEKWDRQKRWYQRSWNVLSRLGGRVAAKNAIICSTVVADCWLPANQGMDFALRTFRVHTLPAVL